MARRVYRATSNQIKPHQFIHRTTSNAIGTEKYILQCCRYTNGVKPVLLVRRCCAPLPPPPLRTRPVRPPLWHASCPWRGPCVTDRRDGDVGGPCPAASSRVEGGTCGALRRRKDPLHIVGNAASSEAAGMYSPEKIAGSALDLLHW
jgi:hypothetical protein